MIFLIDDFPLPLFPIRRIFCFASLTFDDAGLLSAFSLPLELPLLAVVVVMLGGLVVDGVDEVSMEIRLVNVSIEVADISSREINV